MPCGKTKSSQLGQFSPYPYPIIDLAGLSVPKLKNLLFVCGLYGRGRQNASAFFDGVAGHFHFLQGRLSFFLPLRKKGGTVAAIRAESGNLRYEYYQPLDDPETILLIDSWTDQAAIDVHHASPMMATIAALREKYDLHMTVERFVSVEENTEDERFIRK